MQHVLVRSDGAKLVPASVRDLDLIKRLDPHQVMRASIFDERSDESHNWYWRFLQYVADGLGTHRHQLHAEVRRGIGYVENIIFSPAFPGGIYLELVSTKKALMSGTAWEEYKTQAVNWVFEHKLPGVRRADVLREVDRMVQSPRG